MQQKNSQHCSLDVHDPLFYHPSAHPSRPDEYNHGVEERIAYRIPVGPDDHYQYDPREPVSRARLQQYCKSQTSSTHFVKQPRGDIDNNPTQTYDNKNDNDAEALFTVDRVLSRQSLNAATWGREDSLRSPPPCDGSFVLRCLMRAAHNITAALEPMPDPWVEPLNDLEQEGETCSETTYNSVGTDDSGDRVSDYPESPIAVAPEFIVTEKRIPSSILMPLDVPASNACLRLDSDRLQATTSKASFLCPLSHEIMMDPVIDPEGYSYERKAIMAWLSKSSVSPVSGQWLEPKQLIPNRGLQRIIQDYFLQEQSEWPSDRESELTWSGNS